MVHVPEPTLKLPSLFNTGTLDSPRILVIKLGALGDFILAMGPFQAIRQHHRKAHITLLTTPHYADFGMSSGYFDKVWIDRRPKLWRLDSWIALIRMLRRGRIHRVYDLQHSDRTNVYYRLMASGRALEWSGIAPGCSHPHLNPERNNIHTIDRQAEQLAVAGIESVPPTNLDWATSDITSVRPTGPFALIVPGGAKHRIQKRWSAQNFSATASWLAAKGITPVLIGGPAESEVLHQISTSGSDVINLGERTSLEQLVALARLAVVALGNDTGPIHLIAASNCPTVVLFSSDSNPALTAPPGAHVSVLRADTLSELEVTTVTRLLARQLQV